MATKAALAERWRSAEGSERAGRLFDAMERRASPADLAAILDGLPRSEEVPGSLDLRGLQFRFGIRLSGLDLSGARLDGGILQGNIEDCGLAGAVLDGFAARNATMRGDFTDARFVRARLNGCWFDQSVLRGANFSRVWLEQASLRGCDCTGATFAGGRIRFTTMTGTVLNGADLSGADLTEAWLDGARFDQRTVFTDAVLTGARLDEDLRNAVAATPDPSGPDYGFALAHFDATFRAVQLNNHDGHLSAVLDRMAGLRDQIVADPDLDWSGAVSQGLPDAVVEEVAKVAAEVDVSED